MSLKFSAKFCQILLVTLFLRNIISHQIDKIIGKDLQVDGYVNQTLSVPIPFKKCFAFETQFSANQQYVSFKPTSLTIQQQKSYAIQQKSSIDLIKNLRSPQSFKHKHMLIFKQYIMLLLSPNKIIIVREVQKSFELIRQYEISELEANYSYQMFKINEQAIIFLNGKTQALILNQLGYYNYILPYQITAAHLQTVSEQKDEVFVAEKDKGLAHYLINKQQKSFKLIQRYTKQFFNLEYLSLVDLSLRNIQNNTIQILDNFAGLIQANINKTSFALSNPKIIVEQNGCEAFEKIEKDHFVMVCIVDDASLIIEALGEQKNDDKIFKKIRPSYHLSYFNDISISGDYFMLFSHKAIDVFASSQYTQLSHIVNRQSQLNLPGLQTFRVTKDNYLFTIQSGYLNKYIIKQSSASLQVKVQKPVQKQFSVLFYGACSQLLNSEKTTSDTCSVKSKIKLNINQQIEPRKEDFSLSAGIIVILIVVFLLIVWICLKKYKGLERQARRILQAYKKKKPTQKFVF